MALVLDDQRTSRDSSVRLEADCDRHAHVVGIWDDMARDRGWLHVTGGIWLTAFTMDGFDLREIAR